MCMSCRNVDRAVLGRCELPFPISLKGPGAPHTCRLVLEHSVSSISLCKIET